MKNVMIALFLVFVCLWRVPVTEAGTIYVNAEANGNDDGSRWEHAHTSLPAAIDSAVAGDEIWVAKGTYDPIRLKSGVRMYGGFSGSETIVSGAAPSGNKVYVSGRGVARPLVSINNDATTIVRGFHFVDGSVDNLDMGGGTLLKASNAMFVECVFSNNTSATFGGAAMIRGGSPSFVNCIFHSNHAGWAGGAVFSRDAASPSFVNSLFYDNVAMEAGAVAIHTGAPTFTNCTLSANRATHSAGGAVFDTLGHAVMRNCVVWGNEAARGGSELFNVAAGRGVTTVSNSDVRGGWPGLGNIEVNPMFVDSATRNFHLQAGSPCLGGGRSDSLPTDVADIDQNGDTSENLPTDLSARPRLHGAEVDMGAFERSSGGT